MAGHTWLTGREQTQLDNAMRKARNVWEMAGQETVIHEHAHDVACADHRHWYVPERTDKEESS